MVSASREIAAGPGRIYELITDPAEQPRWDGNDNRPGRLHAARIELRACGSSFLAAKRWRQMATEP